MKPSYRQTSLLREDINILETASEQWRREFFRELKNLILILDKLPRREWDPINENLITNLGLLKEEYYLGINPEDERYRQEMLVWLHYINTIQGPRPSIVEESGLDEGGDPELTVKVIPYETVDFSNTKEYQEQTSNPTILDQSTTDLEVLSLI